MRESSLGRAMGRLLADRRTVAATAGLGLAATTLVFALSPDSQSVGSVVFMPWVVLWAFSFGAVGGLVAAAVAFTPYLILVVHYGAPLTVSFVSARLASFLVIGAGVGMLATRLHVSERASRTLVEGLPLAMYAESETGGLTYIGPQIAELTGYPPSEWLRAPGLWRRSLHDDDRERVLAAYGDAVAARGHFACEYRLVRADGECVWVRDSSTFVPGHPDGYRQGFIVDVTAEKLAEAQLEQNGRLMRALIDSTIDGICLTDADGNVLITNAPMTKLVRELRIPTEGSIQERLLDLAGRMTEPERFLEHLRELAASPERPSFGEFELAAEQRVFQGFTAPAPGRDGAFVGRIWTLREVTQQRELDRLREAFVATVSHELRTPLTSIVGFLEMIGTDSERLGEEDAHYLGIVRRNVTRLQHMVDDLLLIAAAASGRLALEPRDADLVELARVAIDSARPAATEKGVSLSLDAPAGIGVNVDGMRVSQVLDNLISNAVKFTSGGGGVRVELDTEGAACTIRVVDSGVGIPAAEQPHVFERFFRSSNAANQSVPGTGLGLAIVKAIVESHGGEIAVDSVEGIGTTFEVVLPRRASGAHRAVARREPVPQAPA